MADLAARVGRPYKAEPIAARRVAFLRENFDDVTTDYFMAQSDHLSVDLCTNTLMANFRVNRVCKIDRRGASGHFQHTALRSEGVHFGGSEIYLERGEKFAGLLQFLRPLDELAHPDDSLIVVARDRAADGLSVLVLPMSGDAFLSDAVHFLRANLVFKPLATENHRGVQRLIEVRPRHGDVVLEAA